MNTYRVYVLDTTAPDAPITHIAYVAAEKYGPAWQLARATLRGEAKALTYDVEGKTKFTHSGDDFVVAKIDDIRPRNVKIDKAALTAAITEGGDPADVIAKLQALLGVKA